MKRLGTKVVLLFCNKIAILNVKHSLNIFILNDLVFLLFNILEL